MYDMHEILCVNLKEKTNRETGFNSYYILGLRQNCPLFLTVFILVCVSIYNVF